MTLYCSKYPKCNKSFKKKAVFYKELSLRCFYLVSDYNRYQIIDGYCGRDKIHYTLTEFEKDMLLAIGSKNGIL